MNDKLNILINKAIDLEENKDYKKAIDVLNNSLDIYKDKKYEILFEIAKMQYRNKDYKKAIINFAICANENNKIAEQIIWECYYFPNKESYKVTYKHNRELILKYEYFIGEKIEEFSDLKFLLIWEDDDIFIYYYEKKFVYKYYDKNINNLSSNTVLFICNNIDINFLINKEKQAENNKYLTKKTPFYLYYEQQFLIQFLIQFRQFKQLLLSERVVIIIGKDMNFKFFSNYQTVLPETIIGNAIMYEIFLKMRQAREEDFYKYKEKVDFYYKENNLIKNNIRNKKPRILFLTSRFTTVLQYHTKNCYDVIKDMGLEAEILLEEKDIYRINSTIFYQNLSKLKPDIIFVLDHFRFEDPDVPNEIFFITWIQDHLPLILDENTPRKLGSNDIVLNHMTTWNKIQELGYGKYCKLIDAPVPANEKIYKIYELTKEEKEKYSADISLVCHASETEEFIREFPSEFGEENIQYLVKQILLIYKEHVKNTGKFLYTSDEFIQYVQQSFGDLGIGKERLMVYVAQQMFTEFNQRVFRTTVVDWIIEAGYTNIKLWGNGWIKNSKYSKYAMGAAENGEVLSKIYQASKINIGNNISTTSAARTWECMLSGGFYISNYIPADADITDIRKILKLDEDVICFKNKEDLLQKINYYLSHEKERKIMIKRGREIALEKMTFNKLMKKVLNELAEGVKESE